MGAVKSKATRKIVFTDAQILAAKSLDQFRGRNVTHRDFVEWLFNRQHKMHVHNHAMLTYKYIRQRNNKSEVVHTIVIVEGILGRALTAI